MSKFKGASGPHFLLCPVFRLISHERRAYQPDHVIELTGRIRHRKNPYGRRHQDEYRCSCGRVFWTNYNWSRCLIRPGSDPEATCDGEKWPR